MKYILIIAVFFLASCGNTTAPVKQQQALNSQTPAAPAPKVDSTIRINFKDLTIGQIEQLNELLKKTTYKGKIVQPETEMKTDEVDALLKSLSELPFKEVAQMIDLVYNSGVKQVRAQAK
jgi:uncharacterized lipoprotein YmbA